MKIPLLQGRFLSPADDDHSALVVLIDRVLAQQYFPGRNPIGQSLTIPHWGKDVNVSAQIVGVVGHVKQYGVGSYRGEKPQIYFSLFQLPGDTLSVFRNEITFVVRTPLSAAAVMPEISNAAYGARVMIRSTTSKR